MPGSARRAVQGLLFRLVLFLADSGELRALGHCRVELHAVRFGSRALRARGGDDRLQVPTGAAAPFDGGEPVRGGQLARLVNLLHDTVSSDGERPRVRGFVDVEADGAAELNRIGHAAGDHAGTELFNRGGGAGALGAVDRERSAAIRAHEGDHARPGSELLRVLRGQGVRHG